MHLPKPVGTFLAEGLFRSCVAWHNAKRASTQQDKRRRWRPAPGQADDRGSAPVDAVLLAEPFKEFILLLDGLCKQRAI